MISKQSKKILAKPLHLGRDHLESKINDILGKIKSEFHSH